MTAMDEAPKKKARTGKKKIKDESGAVVASEGALDTARSGAPASDRSMKAGAELARSDDLTRLCDRSYIAGIAGTITVLLMGFLAARRNVLEAGWGILKSVPVDKHLSTAFPLLVVGAVMFAVEMYMRTRIDRGRLLSVSEDLKEKRYGAFFSRCLSIFTADVALIWLFLSIYRSAGEYGFSKSGGKGYYQPWFAVMDYVLWIYLIVGLPYVLLTRAYQHDPKADRKQPAFVVFKLLAWVGYFLRRGENKNAVKPEPFDSFNRTAVLGLFVKAFFVPLMTVFFADQFGHLTKNWVFVLDVLASGGTKKPSVRDLYEVSLSVIFAVDVGLAWAGYVLSSRWIKNGMYSVEPTVLGWLVALLCYPPFNSNFGRYFATPGEHAFWGIQLRPVVILMASCSIASFAFYTAATVMFGLHFSNLTHRGIIRTGPYSIIRHPAYAAKNFSWWCIMFPYAIYAAVVNKEPLQFATHFVGLLALTGMYFWRAITEERHLSKDPEYRDYMKQVPYRFIPGVL